MELSLRACCSSQNGGYFDVMGFWEEFGSGENTTRRPLTESLTHPETKSLELFETRHALGFDSEPELQTLRSRIQDYRPNDHSRVGREGESQSA